MSEDKQGEQEQGRAVIPGGRGGMIRPVRDSVTAAEMVRRRWEKRGAAARLGLRDAAAELTKAVDGKAGLTLPDGSPLENEYDVVRVVTAAHAINAADPSAPGAVQSLNAVDRMAFPAPERSQTAPAVLPGGAQLNLSAEVLEQVIAGLRARLSA